MGKVASQGSLRPFRPFQFEKVPFNCSNSWAYLGENPLPKTSGKNEESRLQGSNVLHGESAMNLISPPFFFSQNGRINFIIPKVA